MKEVDNVLRILRETKVAFQEDNPYELKKLSNQTIHSATISQDGDNVIVAVLVYSLGKILERSNYRDMEGWDVFYKETVNNLDRAIESLKKNNFEECRVSLGRIRNSINHLSGDLSRYIRDIFRKAEINKAFKIYEHGISLEQASELLGVSLWDLSSFIGQSTISEAKVSVSLPVKKRIKIAEDIFG